MKITILGSLLFSGNADSEKLLEEMERAKYDAEMKAAAEEEITKSQQQSTQVQEKIGIEKRIREGKDDKVFKVNSKWMGMYEQNVFFNSINSYLMCN